MNSSRPSTRYTKLLPALARQGLALLPGLALAAALAWLSIWGSDALGVDLLGFGRSPISPVMVVIVLGILIGNVVRLPGWLRPGLQFAVKRVLRLGIILLGIRLSIGDVFRLGILGVSIPMLSIVASLLLVTRLNRWLRLPARLGTLIAVGTSICGVPAIVAAAPAIEAEEEEIAYAIAVITLFGIVAMLIYPYLALALFRADAVKAGMFLGTAIHDTAQVAGAGELYSDVVGLSRGLVVATFAKLVRNTFVALVIPLVALDYARRRPTDDAQPGSGRTSFWQRFPHFILGFLALALLRAVGDAGIRAGGRALGLWRVAGWGALTGALNEWAVYLMVAALAGVGLMTPLSALRKLGARPLLVGLGAALLVGCVSAGVILLVGV